MSASDQPVQATIASIVAAFASDVVERSPIPRSRILEWMSCSSLEIRGALYSMIGDANRARHVEPALQFEDYFEFVVTYLLECIVLGPQGEWSDSRYLAGHQLVAWFIHFWNDNSVPRSKLAEIRTRLATAYKDGNEDIRDAIVNGCLEHLFEHKAIARFFKDWQKDPILRAAYEEAGLWQAKKL